MSKIDELLVKRIMTIVSRTEETFKRLKRNAAAIEKLQELLGKELCSSEYDIDTPYFEINREDLPKVRKAVGRLTVVGKEVAWDYNTTGEIDVKVSPASKEYDFVVFRYRTKLRPSAKCKVVENTSVYRSLVCGA